MSVAVVVTLRYYIRGKNYFYRCLKRRNLTVFTINSPFIIRQMKLPQGAPETPDGF
jgi:hypothetical protein